AGAEDDGGSVSVNACDVDFPLNVSGSLRRPLLDRPPPGADRGHLRVTVDRPLPTDFLESREGSEVIESGKDRFLEMPLGPAEVDQTAFIGANEVKPEPEERVAHFQMKALGSVQVCDREAFCEQLHPVEQIQVMIEIAASDSGALGNLV